MKLSAPSPPRKNQPEYTTKLPKQAMIQAPSSFDAEAWFATPELRASSKMLLEVSVSWQGALLDIAHYKSARRLTFGSDPRADFCYALASSLEHPIQQTIFPLVEPTKNGGYLLCFDPDMNGFIEENGEQHKLLALVKAGKAHSFDRLGLCYYPLQPGAIVQISCMESIQIQLRFVEAPPISKAWFRCLDSSAPILSFSILIHLLMTFLTILSLSSSPASKSQTNPNPNKVIPLAQVRALPISTEVADTVTAKLRAYLLPDDKTVHQLVRLCKPNHSTNGKKLSPCKNNQ